MRSRHLLFILLISFILILSSATVSSTLKLPGRIATDRIDTDNNFEEFKVLDLFVSEKLEEAISGTMIFPCGDSSLTLILEKSNLWTGPMHVVENDGTDEYRIEVAEPQAFKGYIAGDPTSNVRLTFSADKSWVSGYVINDIMRISFEPRKRMDSEDGSREHYVYGHTPSNIELAKKLIIKEDQDIKASSQATVLKLIVFGDAEYYSLVPGDYYSNMVALINDVEGIFANAINISFEVTTWGCYVNPDNQPITSHHNLTMLEEIRTEFANPDEAHHQLVCFLTGKVMNDVLGTSSGGLGRCDGFMFAVQIPVSPYPATAYAKMIVTAHEFGHNFRARHDFATSEWNANPLCLWTQYTIMYVPGGDYSCITNHFSAANFAEMNGYKYILEITNIDFELQLNNGKRFTRTREIDAYIKNNMNYNCLFALANINEGFDWYDCIDPIMDYDNITVSWTLPDGDGNKAVTCRTFNPSDRISNILSSVILDQTPPSQPMNLTSSTHQISTCSVRKEIELSWEPATDLTSGVQGYSYSWSSNTPATPDTVCDIDQTILTLSNNFSDSGQYYFNITALDSAGWQSAVSSIGPFIINPIGLLNGLSLTADTVETGQAVTISWDEITNATGFTLFEDGELFYEGIQASIQFSKSTPGEYRYRLVACNSCGCSDDTLEIELVVICPTDINNHDAFNLPKSYSLSQNYPNPFNPATHIGYALPEKCWVTIEIYDLLGHKIITLFNAEQSAGNYSISWDGTNENRQKVASGIYLYRLSTDKYTATKKMMLLK